MGKAAFESITTSKAWYANEAVAKYDAVMFDTDGKFAKADGTGIFAGICQYGAEKAGNMATVVRGIFPGVVVANATAGTKLMIDSANPGKFKAVTAGTDVVVGILLYDATAGDLAAISTVEN